MRPRSSSIARMPCTTSDPGSQRGRCPIYPDTPALARGFCSHSQSAACTTHNTKTQTKAADAYRCWIGRGRCTLRRLHCAAYALAVGVGNNGAASGHMTAVPNNGHTVARCGRRCRTNHLSALRGRRLARLAVDTRGGDAERPGHRARDQCVLATVSDAVGDIIRTAHSQLCDALRARDGRWRLRGGDGTVSDCRGCCLAENGRVWCRSRDLLLRNSAL